jgi:transcription elongation factor Elf1
MEAKTTTFDTTDSCPDCNKPTHVVKLGGEPAREICGRFGCSFDGHTLE